MRHLPRGLIVLVLALPGLAAAQDRWWDGDADPDVVVQEPDGDLEVKDASRVQAADRVLGPEHDFADRRRVVVVDDDGDFRVMDADRVRSDDPRLIVYQDRTFRRWHDGRWVTWNGLHPGWRSGYHVYHPPTVYRPPVVYNPPVRRLGRLDLDEDLTDGWLLDTDGDGLFG